MENNKMMCEICSSEFTPEEIGKNHYIARDNVVIGLAAITKTTEYKLYDAFDCPFCKCQNIIGERKRCNNVIGVEKTLEEDKPDCYGCCSDEDIECTMCNFKDDCIQTYNSTTIDGTEVDVLKKSGTLKAKT